MAVGNFEDMLREFNNGTYDFTDNGKCTQCGACCSNLLPMTDEEIETIRKYIKKNGIKEHRHILPLAEPTIDMTCPFLNDSKKTEKCDIYEVRPRVCRDFSCCPSERKPLDIEWGLKAKARDVRTTFSQKPRCDMDNDLRRKIFIKNFSRRLIYAIKKSNMTQSEIAKAIGVTEASMSRYVNGSREPKAYIINELSNILNVSTDYLLNGNFYKEINNAKA